MKKQQKPDNTHLMLEERKIIQAGIENGATKAAIGRTIGKDETTVAKEIRKHRQLRPRSTYDRPVLCARERDCGKKPCRKKSGQFEEVKWPAVRISPSLVPHPQIARLLLGKHKGEHDEKAVDSYLHLPSVCGNNRLRKI